jgi:hypothetical protein
MDGHVNSLRVKRVCWFCHREMQGYGLNIEYYPARTTEYGRGVVSKLGQDTACIAEGGQSVSVCLSCASMIQNQADAFARRHVAALRTEIEVQISELVSAMSAIEQRVESLAHRH